MGQRGLAAAYVLVAALVVVAAQGLVTSHGGPALTDVILDTFAHLRGKRPTMSNAPPGSAEKLASLPDDLWPDAVKVGISRPLFDRAFARLTLDEQIFDQLANQPETVTPPWEYLANLVSDPRIATGRDKLREMTPLLAQIEERFGVDRHILIAIWGIESNFGTAPGERSVIRSLATLTVGDARRAPFWRNELLAALVILDRGDIPLADMKGSWAGAMGHTQFMPSSVLSSAVDFDGDGRLDIWNSAADALASSANYLRNAGWLSREPWGCEVVLPPRFDYAWTAPEVIKTMADWASLGVRSANGTDVPACGARAGLILPTGARGPAFLVTDNFQAILKYNNSISYALAVGTLADRIAGGKPISGRWPTDEPMLSRAEREDIQRRLAAAGFDPGAPDGVIGTATRAAIRSYQRQHGLPEDGYPTLALLSSLRQHGPQ